MIRGTYEVVANVPCHLGEGPLWHPDEGRLYWTDIDGKRIYRLDPDTGKVDVAAEPGMRVGGMTLQTDGSIALFGDDGKITLLLDGQLHPILPGLPEERGTRFNDVFADPIGRVFAGTMPKEDRKGRLYRIDPDLSETLVLEDIGCSNGMGLSPEGNLYYTDTSAGRIYRFDYDPTTGELTNQTTFIQFQGDHGAPDGMTVDAEGNLWVAFWGGSCVRAYGPDGVEKARLDLPVECVTAPVILPDGRMYVTTAGGARRKSEDDLAGSVFLVRLDVAGVPEHRSRLGMGAAS
ncbi:MAG: SMP-30/gluconolactonase/LRE family protein [Fimbriimonas sp.]